MVFSIRFSFLNQECEIIQAPVLMCPLLCNTSRWALYSQGPDTIQEHDYNRPDLHKYSGTRKREAAPSPLNTPTLPAWQNVRTFQERCLFLHPDIHRYAVRVNPALMVISAMYLVHGLPGNSER